MRLEGLQVFETYLACKAHFFTTKYNYFRFNGKIEKISAEKSKEYFNTRDYTSRIGAWASDQSKPLRSRFTLMREVIKYMAKFKNDVPLPDFWGGYILVPEQVEFWQGRKSRLHDRF